MKPAFVLCLAGSLAVNLALLGVLVAGKVRADASPVPVATLTRIATKPTPDTPVVDDKTWESLRSENLPAMVARLRASGFPPDLVRAIMAVHLRESFAARRKALDPGADTRPFWKSITMDAGVQTALRQLDREQQKMMRELLGADAEPTESPMSLYQGRRMDTVPAEKLGDVRRILRDFDDARQDVYGSGGMMGAEQSKKLAALEKDQRAALAGILFPQELADYELRNSDTSRNVRYQLSAFTPSEDEFRAIYKLQAQYDEHFGRYYSMLPPAEEQRRQEAQRQLNEQIKATLGPVRGSDYERTNDFYYRQTSQLVARLELPAETTQKVWDIQKDLQARSQKLYGPGAPQPAERTARLAEFAREAETKITTLLGARGFDAYKQYGGSWMQSFRPRPAPAGAK